MKKKVPQRKRNKDLTPDQLLNKAFKIKNKKVDPIAALLKDDKKKII